MGKEKLSEAVRVLDEARKMLWDMYKLAGDNTVLINSIAEVKKLIIIAKSLIEDYLIGG